MSALLCRQGPVLGGIENRGLSHRFLCGSPVFLFRISAGAFTDIFIRVIDMKVTAVCIVVSGQVVFVHQRQTFEQLK